MKILKETREKQKLCNVQAIDSKILYKDGNDNKVKPHYD